MHTLFHEDFVAAAAPVELGDDEIHLWLFPRREPGANARADASGSLRGVLAAYLGADPAGLRIERDVGGKPYLPDAALQFNQSHSAGALLVGVSRTQPLGVDIESRARMRPYLEIARRYFTADEADALAALPEDQRQRSFLELWSAKEAVLKAIGRGIAFGLDRVGFELDAAGTTRRLVHVADEVGVPEQWQVVRLAPQTGVTGALAWRGAGMRLRGFIAVDDSAAATIRTSRAS